MTKKRKVTLDKLATKVDKLGTTVDKFATLMVGGFENLNEKVDALSNDMTDVKRDIGEIKTDLKAHGKAIDKDAVALINHETRIKKLEHVR
ncbi:hypothetical protein A3B35_03815 [Candidatus Kaiserbacteria bacterium RIFCSPLOWO2_01_FULL_54_24]|uniref:Uncharacterized protein n=1 Tax=Candidatus Kaiserbacteria bacterium RIFCSPLOWO2_01_FULL_54_24 TaxID=1798515 RepID=A0A1F6ESU9_9BACT|nr:MAG: hypothetical protein A3B35_03815 [Candidatus Kaiserbacteria bacterium RIFCSPLOWO2_01_FULL_54_24]